MISYDIQTQQQGNWVNYTSAEDKESAVETAKRLFGNKACTGVRVVQIQPQPGGKNIETEILCETRTVKVNDIIRFSQIDWVPAPCSSLDDYYGSTSRRLMARIFREYCDKMVVTPTELLYSAKEAARIQERGTLVGDAIAKVAALQTGENAAAAKVRIEEINKAMEQMLSRARKADRLNIPGIQDRFSKAMAAARTIETQGEAASYVAMVALARDLSAIRDWLGKVYHLAKLAEADADHPEALAALDGAIADSLAGSVVQDILGPQPHLAAAIIAMLDLAEGKLVTEKSDAGRAGAIINHFCGLGNFPQTQQSLIDRAHRQLATGGPLNRADPGKEKDVFFQVRDRLMRPGGFYCGPDTAEALTLRYGRMVEAGGQTGRKAAFNGVFFSMPDRAAAIVYLCDMARTQFAKDVAGEIIEKFDTVMNCRSLLDLTRQGLAPKERMQRGTQAYQALAQSVFPPAIKAKLTQHLDVLLDRVNIELKLLEGLNATGVSAKERALALAQFCAPGTLPPGTKALARYRDALLAQLAEPGFDQAFLAESSDAHQADKSLAALRAFAQKLAAT